MSWRVLPAARLFDLTPEPLDFLVAHDCEIVPSAYGGELNETILTPGDTVALLDGVDAVIGDVRMPDEVIRQLPRLKHISRRGVGYDTVDVESASRSGIVLTTTPGTVDDAVADHVFALAFAVARRVVEADRAMRSGDWSALLGVELCNKTLGIVGLGRIGRKVARRASGFGMRVLAFDRNPYGAPEHVEFCSLDRLLTRSDFVSVNTDLNRSSEHLIGSAELQSMKSTAILLNTSRGAVIDEQALHQALVDGTIAGAGIDTFENEMGMTTPLFTAPTAVLTPHIGGFSKEGIARSNMMAAQNVVGVMGGDLWNDDVVVNHEIWAAVAGTRA